VKSPVLFLVFNRPDTTRRVFEAIRAARPPKLYIAADGPRPGRPGEAELCNEVRSVAGAVDWPCELHTLFRERNLGCKAGVSGGLEWFFSQEEEGIIVEDDVLPESTFFDFCDEMLDRYRHDERVAMIAGSNLVSKEHVARNSYFFTYYCNIWGWATWRRVWRHYDAAMREWPAWRDAGGLRKVSAGSALFESHWRPILDSVHAGKIDTWDYQWTFTCWRLGGMTILPAFNQTRNLGFGAGATHTTADAPEFVLDSRARPLEFPLTHPKAVELDSKANAMIGSRIFGINAMTALKQRFFRIPVLGNAVSRIKGMVRGRRE
jgi:hypothetical protein